MKDFINEINESNDLHPVILSAKIHQGLTFIHPFVDANGRTARLLMNLTLIRNGYPPTCIYFNQRKDYYGALEAANFGNIEGFYYIIASSVRDSMEDYLSFVKSKDVYKIEKLDKNIQTDEIFEIERY